MKNDRQKDFDNEVKKVKIVMYIRVGNVDQLSLEEQKKHMELIRKKCGKGKG